MQRLGGCFFGWTGAVKLAGLSQWADFSGRLRVIERAAALALCLVLQLFPLPSWAAEPFELTILHTNDLHAHLAPFDKYGAICAPEKDEAGECLGGSARLATAVAAERAAGGNVILLDAGDEFQGTMFFTRYQGQACAALMNRLGYDAMTLGNHEFDEGAATLAAFLRKLSFPALAANLDATGSPALSGLVRPWIVLDVNGHAVGVVGVANPDTPSMSSPGPGLAFQDPAGPVSRAVADLRAQGVDVVVALSHLGLDGDRRLAAEVAGLDVIVGGHSHVLLSNDAPEAVGPCPLEAPGPGGGRTLIVTAGYWGRYLGRLHVAFDASGRVASFSGEPLPMDASVRPDSGAAAEVAEFAKGLKELQSRVVGEIRSPLDSEPCRTGECLPGDLRAEAILEAAQGRGAVVALVNGGSVRSGAPAGPLTFGGLLTMFPFADNIAAVTLGGTDLRAVLEHGLGALGGHEGSGRFLQVAGLRYTFDSSRPAGSRLGEVEVAGPDGAFAPLDNAALYRVAVTRFLLRGGDGYTLFKDRGRDVDVDGKDVTTALVEYLREHSPIDMQPDGRVRDLARP